MRTPGQTDFQLEAYNYALPETLIAQEPCPVRDHSRLLVYKREDASVTHTFFNKIADHLPPGSLLVANNVKVMPARLIGSRPTGGKTEFLLLTPLSEITGGPAATGSQRSAEVTALLRPAGRTKTGQALSFARDFYFIPHKICDFGQASGTLFWSGDLAQSLAVHGHLPLPPYIRRPDTDEDAARYQTIYANDKSCGAVAAPTAGLHFSKGLRAELREKGHDWHELTLYVGYGTFSAVRCEDIREHRMHRELINISKATAEAIARAKKDGQAVVAVGTTSARALEGMYQACGEICAFQGETDIFMYPGRSMAVVDHLITNFHLPRSTLLMLVASMAGREQILDVYAEAVAQEYRFFSYGDAMLIL